MVGARVARRLALRGWWVGGGILGARGVSRGGRGGGVWREEEEEGESTAPGFGGGDEGFFGFAFGGLEGFVRHCKGFLCVDNE